VGAKRRSVKPPVNSMDTASCLVVAAHGVEECGGEIDGTINTAHAFIHHDGLGRLPSRRIVDCQAHAAVGVVVAEGAHKLKW